MKNKILSTFLFSILALLVFNSCKKENIDIMETTPDEVIPDTIVCSLTAEILAFPEQEPPVLEVIANGENEPFSYLWSTNDTSFQIEPTQDTLYSVTITDALGRTAESNIIYTTPIDDCSLFLVEIMSTDSIPLLKAFTSFGTAPFTYNWSEGSTTEQVIVTPPGTFSVTVIDANGCTAEDEIIL